MNDQFRLIVCDLDGTLLNNKKKISPFTLDILKRLCKKIPVVLATARAPRDIKHFLYQTSIDTPSICYNGALIYLNQENKALVSHVIELSIVEQLLTCLKQTNFTENILVEKDDQFWVDSIDQDVQGWIDMGCPPHAIGYPSPFLEDSLSKIMVRGDHSETIPFLEEHFGDLSYTFSDSRKIWVEILHKNSNKAKAVNWIADYYEVPLEQTVAFGDADNDLDMLKIVGLGVAMGNASDVVKSGADHITLSNEEDGVGLLLKDLFSL
jgi:Cof subfamily protein (haloacid dehalogenase superfamily)